MFNNINRVIYDFLIFFFRFHTILFSKKKKVSLCEILDISIKWYTLSLHIEEQIII